MEVSVHGSKQAISMLHLSILSSTIVSRFNKLHRNARKCAHCYEYIQQVVSKCTIMQPIAMSTPLQKSSVECIYIILLHRFLTRFSCSFSQKDMRQPRVQTRTVPADASMTIKFAWSVMVIHKLSADLICPWYHSISKHVSSIYEPNYHAVQLTPCQ